MKFNNLFLVIVDEAGDHIATVDESAPLPDSPHIPVKLQEHIVDTFADLTHLAHKTACEKGFHSGHLANRSVGELLALVHSEISEALEQWRETDGSGQDLQTITIADNGKAEGFAIELADAMIRIFDICGRYRINLGRAIIRKMIYNQARGFRHGGKIA